MDSVSLYPIVFCGEQAGNQSSLYHRGRGRNFEKGETCGFTTYFNSFSLKKWKKYTTRETFTLAIGGRIVKRLLMGKMNGLRYLALALKDFNGGFYRLTETGADEKMAGLKKELEEKSRHSVLFRLTFLTLQSLAGYGKIHKNYLDFRDKELKTPVFWKKFLHIM